MLRLVLASVDFTIFPADASYTFNCLEVVKALLTTTSETCAHIQLPILQSQTSSNAVLNNRRKVEDSLRAASLDVLAQVTQMYDKADSRANDARKTTQCALAVTFTGHEANPWHESRVLTHGAIGPSSLIADSIAFNQMLGFDREAGPPGAAMRTEQILV